jgi:hypothetical protein
MNSKIENRDEFQVAENHYLFCLADDSGRITAASVDAARAAIRMLYGDGVEGDLVDEDGKRHRINQVTEKNR